MSTLEEWPQPRQEQAVVDAETFTVVKVTRTATIPDAVRVSVFDLFMATRFLVAGGELRKLDVLANRHFGGFQLSNRVTLPEQGSLEGTRVCFDATSQRVHGTHAVHEHIEVHGIQCLRFSLSHGVLFMRKPTQESESGIVACIVRLQRTP